MKSDNARVDPSWAAETALSPGGYALSGGRILWAQLAVDVVLVGRTTWFGRARREGLATCSCCLWAFARAAFSVRCDELLRHPPGSIASGKLILGGPAVIFVLVVFTGLQLVPQTTPFKLTVFAHESGNRAPG